MDYIEIDGGKRLKGEINVSGSKNAAVAIIPAAICCSGVCVIENLPHIEDIVSLIEAMEKIGVKCTFKNRHTLILDSGNITSTSATHESVKKLRASYYLLGALIGRFKKAEVTLPGGCNFGSRPIDQHIKGFEKLGAKIHIEHGIIKATADRLIGANIYFDLASVGATINVMLAAVHAEGVTILENAAKEPHVVDTANFLNMMGARIKGAGTDTIRITGISHLDGGEYAIIPDQIEAGTYMIASAITGGDVTIKNIIPKHMDSLTAKLQEMRCKVTEGDDFIRVQREGDLCAVNVKTMTYPGFPTDLQPQMTALQCTANGTGIITENVFDNRFQYINELSRLGCHVTVDGRIAITEGGAKLTGAEVNATDLRAGAALVIAGLAAKGITTIGNAKYIDRGYEDIEIKLSELGANVRRIKSSL